MLHYELSPQDRETLRPFHRGVQVLIEKRANESLGKTISEPKGIFKIEGGVVVNGTEIAIKERYVMDDWKPFSDQPTEEETATVAAINSVVKDFKEKGASIFDGVIERMMTSPLNAMLLD